MADNTKSETSVVKDLDSLAVQFGNSLMESDLKAYNDEGSDVNLEDDEEEDDMDEDDDSNPEFDGDGMSSNDISNDGISKLNHKGDPKGSSVGPESCATVSPSGEKLYKCQDCGQSYNRSSSFSNHRLAHHPSVCQHCGRRFSMPDSLESHLQLVCERKDRTGESEFQCHVCQKKLTSKKILQRHLRLHSNSGLFPCTICSKTFGLKSSLEFHMKSHDMHKPFKCKICFITFSEKSTAIRHLKKQHSQTKDFNMFIESNLKPVNPLELANQINLAGMPLSETKADADPKSHSTPSLKSLLEQPLFNLASMLTNTSVSLSESSEKKGATASSSADHSDTNDGGPAGNAELKTYRCDLCNKSYSHSSSLTKHLKKHDNCETSLYTCSICNKKCLSKRDLNTHVLTHSGVKSYTCPICDSSVARKSSLVRHIRKGHKYSMEEAKEIVKMQQEDLEAEMAESHSEGEAANDDSSMPMETSVSKDTSFKVDESMDKETESMEVDKEIKDRQLDAEKEDGKLDITEEPDMKFQHFTCHICEQIFLEQTKLTVHLKVVHGSASAENEGNSADSNADNKTEDNDDFHVCNICQQLFSEKDALEEHLCKHYGFPYDSHKKNVSLLNKENKTTKGIGKLDHSLFDTTLNVVLEKGKDGVQKVIKVMPEQNSPQTLLNTLPNTVLDSTTLQLKPRDLSTKFDDSAVENLYKPFCCTLCGTRFVEKSSVRRHLKRTHNFTPEEAREYMIRADYTKETSSNKVVEVDSPVTKAADSTTQTWEKTPVEEAEDQEDQNIQRTYLCSVCKKRFMLRSSVRRHLRKIHNFSPEEARECDVLAEENTENVYKIRKPVDGEPMATSKPASSMASVLNKTPKGGKSQQNTPQSAKGDQVSCKFCGQKFRQRFGLKRHLISVHGLEQKEAEEALEEEMNEVNPINLSCSLCFTEFDTAESLRIHLIALHRVSETVAKRIMMREEMSDYTEGIEKDPLGSTAGHDNYEDNYPEKFKHTSVKFYQEPDMDESENVDVDEASEQDENDVLFGLKGDKETLLTDLNFEAINPWGTVDKDEIDSDNLGMMENESGLDFKLTGTEKLMDTDENTDMDLIGNSNGNKEGKVDNDKNEKGAVVPGPSVYLHHRKTYDCPICGKLMSDASARSKHIRRHEGTAGFKCGLCDRIFTQLRLIESHLKTHCGFGVKCGICHIYCAERHGAKRHLHRMHNIESSSEVCDQNILTCTLDCSNVKENANNYTVIDLAKATDIIEVVPNVLLGRREDIARWAKEKEKQLEIQENSEETGEKIEKTGESENVFSDFIKNQSAEGNVDNTAEIKTENKVGVKTGKPGKIDSVISTLHRKLLSKSINESENESDTGSQTETDSQSVYSAENCSPLKIKLTKKIKQEPEEGVKKGNEDKEEEGEMEEKETSVDENDNDSDKTVDYDSDNENNEEESDLTLDGNGNPRAGKGEEVENLDKEIYSALMPHFNYGASGDLDAIEAAMTSLTGPEKTSSGSGSSSKKKPPAHLICWECGKSYSNYKSYREHRRKKHPLSCNQCRQVFVDVLLFQSHMQSHRDGNKVTLTNWIMKKV